MTGLAFEMTGSQHTVVPTLRIRRRRMGKPGFRRNALQERPRVSNRPSPYRGELLTETQRSWLGQDLERAAEVQRKLLPDEHVRIEGWEISYNYQALGPVGGDYCDVITHEAGDSEVLLAFGDASGKGIAASLMMAQLHAIFHSLDSSLFSLKDLVERANRILCKHAVCASYATLVCVRATSAGEIEVCNAGHCSPLIVGHNRITPIESSGFPLGLFPDASYSVVRKLLAKGESVFLYTDGVTEARDRCEREYGPERLLRTLSEAPSLSAQALIETCMQSVAAFQAGVPSSDDLTAMAIRYV